ncbi:MAG TPA: PIG-L family deacetylase [Candidatus Limnocylindria bacterium]|jgi:LmbE family N-acetylglucosaminyl deacetylase|nr:PIG-L family deacetylase [Candidatus Limnocylindria bacterium]
MFELTGPVLVLGAHTDDEFGCVGTVRRLIESGEEVHLATFSSAEESVPEGFDRDVLKREVRAAIDVMGIPPERFRLFDYPVRHFPTRRQEILEDLIVLRREIQPRMVFLPSSSDIHQDHAVIATEGLRAFKHATVLGYELPMNNMSFENQCFVRLEPRHLEVKLAHAAAYRSQAHRLYLRPELLRSLATVRGLQMNEELAESFEVLRLSII